MRHPIIVYIYNSFKDPLFQNLMFKYIQTLNKEGITFYLITFEQPNYALTKLEQKNTIDTLAKRGIYWKPFNHRTGNFLLLKKLTDLFSVFFTLLRWKTYGKAKGIFAFANVAAAQSVIYSILFQLPLFIYSYEPHAKFQVELGLWKQNSIKYKLLNFLEQLAAKKAHTIFTGTKHGISFIKSISTNPTLYRVPTAIDETSFYFRENEATEWRIKNKLENNKIALYLGKFGGLYYSFEILLSVYEALYKIDPSYYFIIISTAPTSYLKDNITQSTSIPLHRFYFENKSSETEEVKILLSTADVGFNIIPPSPSQKFRSPTKTGEYLLSGLPYITCDGISEDDEYANKYNIGLSLPNIDKLYANLIHDKISEWKKNQSETKKRCRKIGLEYRAKSNADILFKKVFLSK